MYVPLQYQYGTSEVRNDQDHFTTHNDNANMDTQTKLSDLCQHLTVLSEMIN